MSERGELIRNKASGGTVDLGALAAACVDRCRAITGAIRRLDALETGSRTPAGSVRPGPDDRRDLMLRMLRTGGNPSCYAVLRTASSGSQSRDGLATATSFGPVAMWETIGDLVQVGLLTHDAETDRVTLTAAGLAMLDLVEQVVERGDEK
jgi:hypothetical protein